MMFYTYVDILEKICVRCSETRRYNIYIRNIMKMLRQVQVTALALVLCAVPAVDAEQVDAPLVQKPPERFSMRYHFDLKRGSGRGELWLDQSKRDFRVTGR